jgi:16S rRNA processing protein RimM
MAYEIGKIINTHGIKGELKVKTNSDFDRFKKNKTIYTYIQEKKVEFKIQSVREATDHLIIGLDAFDNINQVLHLKGAVLYTDEKPKLKAGEYHYQDLIGKSVFNQENKRIGVVTDLLEVPQGHLLQIENEGKKSLVPFVGAFVKSVQDDRIDIEEIEGLL